MLEEQHKEAIEDLRAEPIYSVFNIDRWGERIQTEMPTVAVINHSPEQPLK